MGQGRSLLHARSACYLTHGKVRRASFFVPRSLPEAVASARAGHARWLELELTVYRKGWHRAGPGDEERGG